MYSHVLQCFSYISSLCPPPPYGLAVDLVSWQGPIVTPVAVTETVKGISLVVAAQLLWVHTVFTLVAAPEEV